MLESKSYIATPPGVTIQEQLDDRGMTQKEFAKRVDISEEYISKLIDGEVHLTTEMAEKLELVLGVPASFWNKLEAIYQEKLAKIRNEFRMV
ncbi:helix-turn-helix transcriptional regulator [Megasphaera elsdenii]|uniref:helix-turn-helix transcriptional regulator n=1 Tax=Megasphaera elsdenii TaxID=907 RepID=UPI00242BF8C1|nr:helix-turn-helix domain-containing protein [Megasphaera elsdenii]